jgi:chromosome segregation ATPase
MVKRESRTNRILPHIYVAFSVLFFNGCSSWPWPAGNREAERLTRVIHNENARLKDLVVQMQATREDMAQRAIDDNRRIESLAQENEVLRNSVVAYQSERERMARAFQTLQQQVQVVLSDRATLTSSNASPSTDQASSQPALPPPEGRLTENGKVLSLNLNDWFLPDSSIFKPNQENRLRVLAAWLAPQLEQVAEVNYRASRENSEQVRAVSASQADLMSKTNDFNDLAKIRANRFWENLHPYLPADKSAGIRLKAIFPSTSEVASGPGTDALQIRIK